MADPKPVPFAMPKVAVGQPVVWRHGPGGLPAAALVTAVGKEAISVLVFPTESRVGQPKDGCRHVADPQLARMVQHDGGSWDFTDSDKLLHLVAEAAHDFIEGPAADAILKLIP